MQQTKRNQTNDKIGQFFLKLKHIYCGQCTGPSYADDDDDDDVFLTTSWTNTLYFYFYFLIKFFFSIFFRSK